MCKKSFCCLCNRFMIIMNTAFNSCISYRDGFQHLKHLHLHPFHHSRPFKAKGLFMYSMRNWIRFWCGNCTQHIRLTLNCRKIVLCLTQTQTAMIQPTCLTRNSIMLRSMILCFELKILNLRGSSIIGTDAVPIQLTMWSKLSSVFSVIILYSKFLFID